MYITYKMCIKLDIIYIYFEPCVGYKNRRTMYINKLQSYKKTIV